MCIWSDTKKLRNLTSFLGGVLNGSDNSRDKAGPLEGDSEACNNRPASLSARAWLEENGIKVKTYYYWLRRIRREAYEQIKSDNQSGLTLSTNRNVSYAEITLTGNTSSGQSMHPVAVISSGNLSIDISENASEEFLIKLMRAIKYVG